MKIIPTKMKINFLFAIPRLNKNRKGKILALTNKMISKSLMAYVLNKPIEMLVNYDKNYDGQIIDRILTD
ncbi:hypothetical protein IIF7_14017 [Zunongwangia atlantica 22II14-10F7]|uniref:Uncharacterized protein n=1 Tax=Zunongwangia atlantica 22II14-10F7 TaxID=1185767 RepID=A0A1Y1T1M0_9FLAO|nr:hypothetical protein IIF7_14017 [Zunongwangia atlantica 22II14-10F7]